MKEPPSVLRKGISTTTCKLDVGDQQNSKEQGTILGCSLGQKNFNTDGCSHKNVPLVLIFSDIHDPIEGCTGRSEI